MKQLYSIRAVRLAVWHVLIIVMTSSPWSADLRRQHGLTPTRWQVAVCHDAVLHENNTAAELSTLTDWQLVDMETSLTVDIRRPTYFHWRTVSVTAPLTTLCSWTNTIATLCAIHHGVTASVTQLRERILSVRCLFVAVQCYDHWSVQTPMSPV